ncbi:MAG: hypothetical protein IPK70_05685 [Flavobacteriales bacterium]|jgi:hypothetical protein|nr:hypothetical protein [Flavobacteriales bacterium]
MKDLRYIRCWLAGFVVALVLSGLTAVPLVRLTGLLQAWTDPFGGPLHQWASHAADAVAHVDATYPILFYGTDWLAFAHVLIGLAFIGPYRDPIRNKWVVEWGLWSCGLVVLLAFAWAPVRDIPFFWRCVDASFGVFGALPLLLVLKRIQKLEAEQQANP